MDETVHPIRLKAGDDLVNCASSDCLVRQAQEALARIVDRRNAPCLGSTFGISYKFYNHAAIIDLFEE